MEALEHLISRLAMMHDALGVRVYDPILIPTIDQKSRYVIQPGALLSMEYSHDLDEDNFEEPLDYMSKHPKSNPIILALLKRRNRCSDFQTYWDILTQIGESYVEINTSMTRANAFTFPSNVAMLIDHLDGLRTFLALHQKQATSHKVVEFLRAPYHEKTYSVIGNNHIAFNTSNTINGFIKEIELLIQLNHGDVDTDILAREAERCPALYQETHSELHHLSDGFLAVSMAQAKEKYKSFIEKEMI